MAARYDIEIRIEIGNSLLKLWPLLRYYKENELEEQYDAVLSLSNTPEVLMAYKVEAYYIHPLLILILIYFRDAGPGTSALNTFFKPQNKYLMKYALHHG